MASSIICADCFSVDLPFNSTDCQNNGNDYFNLCKIDQKSGLAIEKIARCWSQISEECSDKIDIFDQELSSRFATSHHVAVHIANQLQDRINGSDLAFRRDYVCLDPLGDSIEGIMVTEFRGDDLEILFLMTHPRNIDYNTVLEVAKERFDEPVKGVGTALVHAAYIAAFENGCEKVTVAAYNSSIGFYEKCGFNVVESGVICTRMEISLR